MPDVEHEHEPRLSLKASGKVSDIGTSSSENGKCETKSFLLLLLLLLRLLLLLLNHFFLESVSPYTSRL